MIVWYQMDLRLENLKKKSAELKAQEGEKSVQNHHFEIQSYYYRVRNFWQRRLPPGTAAEEDHLPSSNNN